MKTQKMEHTKKESPHREEQNLPQKKGSKKVWIAALSGAAVLTVVLVVGILAATGMFRGEERSYEFILSRREAAVELGEMMQLEVIPDEECRNMKPEITWLSSNPAVATVSEDGSVTAVAGGESKITAIARYGGEEYSASCMVTVKAPGLEYSDYRLRWFTQSKDRRTYLVKEETFERLVGSEVELDEKYAMRQVPAQYVLNKEKSTWTGQVRELPGQCILEIYFDVAEIEYFVDCYYESDRKLGTYGSKETLTCTAYAFSEVEAPGESGEGFVLNEKNEDAVTRLELVETGARLSAYYDRIRSQATISYDTGRNTAVYTNVYGVGLLDAPADALTDSLEMYDVTSCCYINGERTESAESELKKATQDVSVHVKLEGTQGWFVEADGTLQNLAEWSNMPAFIFLKGSGSSLYLSAIYDLTGSQTNMVGITLRSGGTSRELRFADRGVYIWKDQGGECGILNEGLWRYNDGGTWGEAFIWNQNSEGLYGTTISSVVNDMIKNPGRSSHDMIWAVQEGMLFCNIDGIPVLRIPLNKLDQEWTADKEYSIGFSAFDGVKSYNDLRIRNISVCYGEEARKHMYLGGQVEGLELSGVAYNVLTGSYLPSSVYGFNFLNGPKKIGNTGISADVRMLNMANSCSGYGVSVQAGDRSVQYIMQGNSQARRHDNAGWESMAYLRTMEQAIPFKEDGTSHIEAFVKDGYFYITYNGVQAQCINMMAQFPDYDPKTTAVSVGIASCDARLGLAEYRNVGIMSEKAVANAKSQLWGFYSELTTDAGPTADGYSFAEGFFAKTEERWTVLPLMGTGKIWQIEGTMERTDSAEAELLRMGFEIQADGKDLRLLGNTAGIMAITNYGADWIGGYHMGVNEYVLNTKAGGFFKEGRSKDKIDFKAVIYQDVFYLWMDGALCWRVPLTENGFGEDGSFAKGSGYQLSLMMGDGAGLGRMSNLKVQMNSQVTNQKAFLTDSDGKAYSFLDGITLVESSRDTYLALNASGMMMDTVDQSYVASDTQWYDWIYGEAGTGNRGISADLSWLDRHEMGAGVGVIIKSGDKEHRFMNWSDENNYHLNIEHMISVGDQSAGGTGDIGNWTYRNAPPFQEDGSSHVDAFVKDGYFYICYNGSQALCMSMVSLFSDYDPDTSEFSVGVGGVAMNISQARFKNLTELSEDEVADIATEQWPYYAEGMIADDYNYAEGTFEKKTEEGWRTLPLGGSSRNWLVTGTMERTDDRSSDLQMGFEVQCGEEKLRVMGQNYGMMPQYQWGYNEGVNDYVINTKAGSFFHDKTAESIAYQAAIYQDVLYVWFDDVLSWRVPLVNTKRAGDGIANFEPGSEYQLTLLIGQEEALGRMTDLDVKMGYQVTGQTEFMTDSTGKSYSFQETITAIEKNLDIYLADEHPGMMLENALEISYATQPTLNGVASFYGKPGSGNHGVSVDISLADAEAHMATGIVIRSGEKVHQFQAWHDNSTTKNWWLGHIEGEDLLMAWDSGPVANILELLPAGVSPYDDEDCSHVDAFVKDDYFYICYNGKQALCMNMAALFQDYDPSDEVSIGITGTKGAADTGQAEFANVAFLAEAEVGEIVSQQWNCYSEKVQNADDVSAVLTDARGTVEKKNGEAWMQVPLQGNSKTWQVEGTMQRVDDAVPPMGFEIEAGGKNVRILGRNNGFVPILAGGWPWLNGTYENGVNDYAFNTRNVDFFAGSADQISFKAVIYQDVLYAWFDGDLCWRVPLADSTFRLENGEAYNFTPGSEYRLTLMMADGGVGRMTDLDVKMGYQVTGQTEFMADSTGKNYSFQEAITAIEKNVDTYLAGGHPSMMLENALEISYATPPMLNGVASLYGKPRSGNHGVSVDISLADAEAHMGTGVVIRSGEKVHQFQAWHDSSTTKNWWLGHIEGENLLMAWDQGPVTNILELLPAGVSPYDDEDCSHVDAFVKDGYFYICYSGKQALCMNMAALFQDYDPASTEVAIGITGTKNAADRGQAKYSNVTWLSEEETVAKAEAIGAVQKNFYTEDLQENRSYGLENGSVTVSNSTGDWKTVTLPGSSRSWQVEGTIEVDGRQWIGFGVIRKSDGARLELIGYNNGIVPRRNNEGGENPNYWELNTSYILNDKAANFFADPGESGNRQISFKAVVAGDMMYVWFDSELCWRFPLYENEFGFNLGKENDYQFLLTLGSWGTKKVSNLDVKMGYQVTGETEFVTDSTGKSYSFQEAITTIEKNVDTYLAGGHPNMMLENALEGIYATVRNFRGWAYSYGREAIGNQGMSADISVDAYQFGAGIVIKSGDQVHQFQAWSGTNDLVNKNWMFTHTEGEGPVANQPQDYANILSLIPQDALPYNSEGLSHVDAFVKDGYFYICYNGKQALCLNMAALFRDYDAASSEVSLGIGVISTENSWGQAKYSNVTWLSEEETAARAEAIGAVQRNFWIESVPNGCNVDLEKGTVSCEANGALKTVILPGSSKSWQVEGTIETTGRQWIGFGVEAGGNTLELLGFNHPDWHPDDSIFVRKNYAGIEWTYNTSYVLSQKAKEFFIDNGQADARRISFKAVVAGDVLYVWFDGELCWQVPLSANEFGFNLRTGNEYHFMLTLGDWGAVKVSNLNVKQGSQVIPPAQTADFNAEAIRLDGTVSNAEDPSVDGTVSDAEDTSEDGTATNEEDTPEDGTATNEEDPPEDGTATNEEDTPEDGTATNEEDPSEDGTAANEENPPEDGTESDEEDTPEDGTASDAEDIPEDGTESDEEDTPLDGKATNAEAIPPDGKAANAEDSPEDGTVSDSRRRIRRVFHRSDSDRLEFVLKKRIKKHEQI